MAFRYGVPAYGWSDDAVEMLKALWAGGKSASEIASELPVDASGITPSRSAILGKINRMGLSGRGGRTAGIDGGETRKIKAAVVRNHRRPAPRSRPTSVPVTPKPERFVPPKDAPAPVNGTGLTIIELRFETNAAPGTCRYPLGPVMRVAEFYCGNDTKPGSPWCPYHHGVCHQPTGPAPKAGPEPGKRYEPLNELSPT